VRACMCQLTERVLSLQICSMVVSGVRAAKRVVAAVSGLGRRPTPSKASRGSAVGCNLARRV